MSYILFMNIALIGYGKMGKAIHSLAESQKIRVASIIDPRGTSYKSITEESMQNIDVCIDFTTPEVCIDNIKNVLSFKKPLVVGTTGWHARLPEIKELVGRENGSLVYASNFSIGVNLLYALIDYSSKLLSQIPEYDPYLSESHHKHKKDAPSGTAKELISILLKHYKRKENELSVGVTRAGSIPGIHEIGFDSEFDTISIKHTARNRNGFALGALLAAGFIQNKKGLYNFKDEFENIIGGLHESKKN